MKLNKNYIQTFIFILVYLFAIYFWSQPYQERKLPYGEHDAVSHFEVGDYMAYNDKSFQKLPPYIDIRYGHDNKFKPHTLWYPPTFHSALGVIEVIGGERIVSIFLLNTVMATFIIISIYFVINSLFGFFPAILSSLFIIFSPRDFMPYLWGQWPERFAYAFIPIILYCFYKYFISFSKDESKPIYFYLTALFLGINLLIHPLVFFHSIVGLIVLYAALSLKQKKFVFSFKHTTIGAVIFLILFLMFPYQTFNIFPQISPQSYIGNEQRKTPDLSRLFHWSLDPDIYAGSVPAWYFSFKDMNGLWTLPFLLFGIFFLVLRREDKDLFMLAWLISLYIILHRDIFGKAAFLHRSLSATAHIFAPLTAIGAVYLGSFVKMPLKYNRYLKYAMVLVFAYFVFSINFVGASKMLNKNTYNPYTNDGFLSSLNNEEYQAGQWVLENVPDAFNITLLGIPYTSNFLELTAKKIRWMAAVSQHVYRFYYLLDGRDEYLKHNYVLLDYTLLGALNDKETLNEMQSFEKNKLANHTLVYDKNNIRVYKPELKKQ